MSYSIRQLCPQSKWCQQLGLDGLLRSFLTELLLSVLACCGRLEVRERRLNQVMTILILLLQALFPTKSLRAVMSLLLHPIRMLCSDPCCEKIPGVSALCYRREQLRVAPLRQLFSRVCGRLATCEEHPYAFGFGLRLLAIDSTLEAVPDTAANAAVFGSQYNRVGRCAYPLVRGIYLIECGTHAIIDATFWPCRPNEQRGARRLLKSVGPGDLLMLDSGFHGYPFAYDVLARGAHLLSRLPAGDQPQAHKRLCDGTLLVHCRPSDRRLRTQATPLLLRQISYSINDPSLPGYNQVHRLLTSLLDPDLYPAAELICLSHERWEIELAIDEIDSHQRLCQRTWPSRTPLGVIQELYATLLIYYAVRAMMLEAATQAQVDPDRLSFTHALCVLVETLADFQRADRADWPHLWQWMLDEIASVLLPPRCLRTNPRAVKRRASKHKAKRLDQLAPPQPPKGIIFQEVLAIICLL